MQQNNTKFPSHSTNPLIYVNEKTIEPPGKLLRYIIPAVVFMLAALPIAFVVVDCFDGLAAAVSGGLQTPALKLPAIIVGLISTGLWGAFLGQRITYPIMKYRYWKAAIIGLIVPIPSLIMSISIYNCLFVENIMEIPVVIGSGLLIGLLGTLFIMVSIGHVVLLPLSVFVLAGLVVAFISKLFLKERDISSNIHCA